MKKVRKLIVRLFLLILILLIISLQIPGTFGNKKANSNYDFVLSESITNMDARIVDIGVLGSHDAFSDGITYSSKPNSNEGGITNNKIVNTIGKGLVVRMSKAQMVGAKDQLNAGVRYFDVRITKIDNEYYTCHGYLSNTLDIYLKEIVEFLDNHPGEYVIFDIQHFYANNHEVGDQDKEEFTLLLTYIESVKSNSGKSLIDYVNYNPQADNISTLTYGKITSNKATAGVIMLGYVHDNNVLYFRDGDANYNKKDYENIFSLWHQTNSTTDLISGIEEEVTYLKDSDYLNILRVNQAQRTGFMMNAKLVKSLCSWSIINMAKSTNKELVKDKTRFLKYLEVMPIFMVDYSTSNVGNFNELANTYIALYNKNL